MDAKSVVQVKANPNIPELHPGDTVKVSVRVVEGDRERIQVFQGVVIKMRGGGVGASFTVRHIAYGIGVERTFPLSSPAVEKVEVVRHGKVRRAKLYYLRGLSGKEARRKIKRADRVIKEIGEDVLGEEPEEVQEPVAEAAPAQGEVVAAAAAPKAEEKKAEKVAEKKPEPAMEKKPEQAPVIEKTEAKKPETETPKS